MRPGTEGSGGPRGFGGAEGRHPGSECGRPGSSPVKYLVKLERGGSGGPRQRDDGNTRLPASLPRVGRAGRYRNLSHCRTKPKAVVPETATWCRGTSDSDCCWWIKATHLAFLER